MNFFQKIKTLFKKPIVEQMQWQSQWSGILLDKVRFYRNLDNTDKRVFEQRALLFLNTTEIAGSQIEVTDEDRLLVAASAIIPVWSFPNWHYFNLKLVVLFDGAFNDNFDVGAADARYLGMVGQWA